MRRTVFSGLTALALLLTLGAGPATAGSEAASALERFKNLAGSWEGKTATGKAVRLSYEVVADGSAVLEQLDMQGEESSHDMVTLYHLDGDRLMLTHYCAMGNQPRMRATSIGAKEVRFDFVDATNMSSDKQGHMHRATFAFDGDDRMSSAWTWREDGEDRFTETIEVRRVESRQARR